MTNIAVHLKNEISRVARKEFREETVVLKKAASAARSEIASLKRRIAALEAAIKLLTKAQSKSPQVEAEGASPRGLRFKASGFVALRKKLDLSAAEMAKLIGVSAHSVYHWEAGKSRPRASQLAAIAEVRKLGKKSAAARLAE